MKTSPTRFFSASTTGFLLVLLLLLPSQPATATTVAEAFAALDNPAGVTITKMEYWKYQLIKENWDGDIYYWFAEDDNGDYIYSVNSGTSKWAVLSKTADTTTPAFGGSCLYSTGVEDGAAARLYLKVRGSGKLTCLVKTSCDDSDSCNVYVDNEGPLQSLSGYGADYTWEETETDISGGPAQSGALAGTPFHEIVFEFFKSEPYYDGSAKIADGPQKADNPDYSAEIIYFKNRIWIDRVVWTPDPVDIVLSPNPNPINDEEPPAEAALRGVFIDTLTVNAISNAEEDFGYHIRYTTDGTTPTASSPVYVEDAGIPLTGTGTIKAKVFDSVATGSPRAVVPEIMVAGTFQAKAATPVLAIDEAASTPDGVLCTAATTTPGAAILYTLMPNATPNLPWPEGGLTVTQPGLVRAMARRPDTLDSDLASLAISQAEPPVVTAQVDGQPLPPRARAYTGANLTVQVASPSGAALYATATGPGAVWTVYTSPLAFNSSPGPVTIQARGTSPGVLASAPVAVTFYPADQSFSFGGLDGAITLHQGWNLLGMPLSPTMETMATLLATWPDVFAVDPTTGTLCRPDWIAQGEGFWLYCEQETPGALAIDGAVCPPTVSSGWRLLTPAVGTAPFSAWRWSPEAGAYVQQELTPGQGGWRYAH